MGSKLWWMNYACGRKQKSLSIVSYSLESLVDARRQLQNGKDPALEKQLLISAQIKANLNSFERVSIKCDSANHKAFENSIRVS